MNKLLGEPNRKIFAKSAVVYQFDVISNPLIPDENWKLLLVVKLFWSNDEVVFDVRVRRAVPGHHHLMGCHWQALSSSGAEIPLGLIDKNMWRNSHGKGRFSVSIPRICEDSSGALGLGKATLCWSKQLSKDLWGINSCHGKGDSPAAAEGKQGLHEEHLAHQHHPFILSSVL